MASARGPSARRRICLESTFGYWRRKLEGTREPQEVRFYPLEFLQAGREGEGVNLVVELPGGVVMRFSGLAR